MTGGKKRRTTAALTALAGLFATLLMIGAPVPADAAKATGVAYGTLTFPHHDQPKVKVLWFTKDWTYLGRADANGGSYYLSGLEAGTYRLQFVDQRASYVTDKYAPTDVKVTVRDGRATKRNVTMTRGAFVTGTVKTHGRPGAKAKVVAANTGEQSFSTTANKKGQFAIGGLPASGYSLFTYDHRHQWVGKSTWAGNLGAGQSSNVNVNLTKPAGNLRVALFTSADGSRRQVTGHPVVTAVSKVTGQFWSKKVRGGSANFQGLYPGRYTLVANGYGNWFAKTAAVKGDAVKAGRSGFGTFTYTKRGGWVTGTVVDGDDPSYPMAKAQVRLWSTDGSLLASTTSADDGSFTLDGALATQDGLTVTVDPDPSSGGWMTAAPPDNWCQFTSTPYDDDVSVQTGRQTDIGSIPLDRSTASGQPTQCLPEGA